MSQTTASKNKALVLKAFDTLFNKRDYAAAERYWSPAYIQHSAHIGPGREGLFNLIKSPVNAEVRAGDDRGRRGLCNRARTIFRHRPACELDRGGYSARRKRYSCGALGCDPR